MLQTACVELAEQWASQKHALLQSLSPDPSEHAAVTATSNDMLEAFAWAKASVDNYAVVDASSGKAVLTDLTSATSKVKPSGCSTLLGVQKYVSLVFPCLTDRSKEKHPPGSRCYLNPTCEGTLIYGGGWVRP